MKKVLPFLLLLLILLQGCVVYQTTPDTLVNAYNSEGAVKLTSNIGKDYYFKKIISIDSAYYGTTYSDTVRIVLGESDMLYLKDVKKSKKVTVGIVVGISIPVTILTFSLLIFAFGGCCI